MKARWQWSRLMILTLLLGCGEPVEKPASVATSVQPRTVSDAQESLTLDSEDRILIAFLGNSLSAGMGVEEDEAFPMIIQERLRELGWSVEVLNAGVSGDTTAGGVSRLKWILRQDPQIVVVELGANDGLRGMSVEKTEANLRQMIVGAEEAGAQVLLAGMMVPPNYGAEYAERFNAVFPRLAAELDVELVPFLLSGVAALPELNLADGIHPNPAGHLRVAETVLPHLDSMLRDLEVSDSPPDP
jgi:acyl-CoA thioesterase-1